MAVECLSCGHVNDAAVRRCTECRELLDPDAWDDAREGYSGMIPSRNPAALASYYLGILSFIPVLGFFFGLAAIVLGHKGQDAARQRPEIKGGGHAIIGLVAGYFFVLIHVVVLIFILLAST